MIDFGKNFDYDGDGKPDYLDRPNRTVAEMEHFTEWNRREEIQDYRDMKHVYMSNNPDKSEEEIIKKMRSDLTKSGYSDEQINWMEYNRYYSKEEIAVLNNNGFEVINA